MIPGTLGRLEEAGYVGSHAPQSISAPPPGVTFAS